MTNLPPEALPQWVTDYATQNEGAQQDTALARMAQLSQEDIADRVKEIRRLQRTSNYGLNNQSISWQLDPLPHIMSQEDWNHLSSGITQRMLLLQQVMADLQGNQSLISGGFLTPQRFMAHPAYLPETKQFLPPSMLLAGFDIAKEVDGRFTLLADHFQYPRGLGVQLENRVISRRIMSEEFAELGIQRIAYFFKHIQESLGRLANDDKEPRVVILSEGLDGPDYAEQAYLATFMDLILARSNDLTVRDGKVWIKSLEGLRRVDVIIRWVADDLLDSLEQPKYSSIGVPGLFMAVRAGNVALINGPGTRMLQIPSVHQALPLIAQSWLEQPLILPQLDTQPFAAFATNQHPDYELKHFTDPSWRTDQLSSTTKPDDNLYWQRKPNLSLAPFWGTQGLQAKPFYFKCFAFWDGQQVTVMPASLCTTSEPNKSLTNEVKDTWIPATGPHEKDVSNTLNIPDTHEDIALIEGIIPSRAAENLFWLGTSLERCENLVRLLRVYIDRFTEVALYPDERNSWSLQTMQNGIMSRALIPPYSGEENTKKANTSMSHKLTVWQCISRKSTDSVLPNAIELVLSSAKQVRELMSYDTLRILDSLQSLHLSMKNLNQDIPLHEVQKLLDKVIAQIMAFNGSILDSFALNSGTFMMNIGRRLERSTQLAATMKTLLIEAPKGREQSGALDAVLLSQVSAVTHRRRYRMKHNVETGIELLLVDAQYPRSMAFQIQKLLDLSKHLPSHQRPGFLSTPDKLLLQIKTQCALAEPATLSLVSDNEKRIQLSEFLSSVQNTLLQYGERIQVRYFSHTQPGSKLAWSVLPGPQEKQHEV